jgi:cell division control protein 6
MTSREMARQLSDTLDDQTNIPRMGIGATDYQDITCDLLDAHDIDVFVAVLNEVDKLDDDEFLRSLIRAKKSGKSDAYSAVVHLDSRRTIG